MIPRIRAGTGHRAVRDARARPGRDDRHEQIRPHPFLHVRGRPGSGDGPVREGGGRIFSSPNEILFGAEKDDGVSFCYGVTPWGMDIEFITYPGKMGYEKDTPPRRWNRGS